MRSRLRVTVGDVPGWIVAGMNWQEIMDDHPYLTEQDVRACLAYASNSEQHTTIAASRLMKLLFDHNRGYKVCRY